MATTATTEVANKEAGGLPQLDFTTFEEQIVWLFLSFIVLLVIVSKVALPRVTKVLEEREERIAGDLDKAETQRRDADETKAAYEASLATARAEAQAVMAEAKAQIQKDMAKAQSELDAKLNAEAANAEAAIRAAKDKALEGLGDMAKDITRDLAEKLAGVDASDADINKAVENALNSAKGA
ncbi:ATP synthase subunit b [Kordiimonas sediminis]|uniref:ATP synthase subunit b n=1 Tax=Kordiimonas sediminis TaxID=1735581 RepID=A0A919AXZ4_9PROT|nr:F0F1 ATP synthase subunit B' [Kordiimonas sediminis]GHF31043.1 ATP synthase subunit b [Kordiimonas sediminis]